MRWSSRAESAARNAFLPSYYTGLAETDNPRFATNDTRSTIFLHIVHLGGTTVHETA